MIQASWTALIIQLCFAVAIGFVTTTVPNPIGVWEVLTGCVILELAIGIFLCHCIFLFPSHSTGRFVPSFVSVFIAIVQTLAEPQGYALGSLITFVVAISITGWFMHRLCGASLSMRDEDVFQEAISTKVLLLLAPLILLMGLIPTLIIMSINPGAQNDFGRALIFSALSLLGLSVVPILSIYAWFWFVRSHIFGRVCITLFAVIIIAAIAAYESLAGNSSVGGLSFAASIAVYFLGIGIAYAPFHARGFRPVWAKRRILIDSEHAIAFDDVT